MSAKVIIMGALFSQMRDVADLHYDGEVVWAASTGGVEVFDLEGRSLAQLDDLQLPDGSHVGEFFGTPLGALLEAETEQAHDRS